MKIADQKKYWYSLGLLFIACLTFHQLSSSNGITYGFSGGRLGDNISAYIHARWIAYSKELDFYYRPFKHSDQLVMHDMHKAYEGHGLEEIHSKDAIFVDPQAKNTMFFLKWYPKNNNIHWDDIGFISLLRNEIRPKQSLPLVKIPEGYVAVAIHIRRGGGFDGPLWQDSAITHGRSRPHTSDVPDNQYQDWKYPTKIPPDQWYIEMIQYLKNLCPSQSFYVYIFTDDSRPDVFAEMYKNALNNPQILFDYRRTENRHNLNVLEDFF